MFMAQLSTAVGTLIAFEFIYVVVIVIVTVAAIVVVLLSVTND